MTTAIVSTKGHLIDSYCSIKGAILEHDNVVYDCTLNQTEINANKNKFYTTYVYRYILNTVFLP